MSTQHPFATDLALYACGDSRGWERIRTALHVRACRACQGAVAAFRVDRQQLRETADQLPAGVNWDRLSTEMAANIRVGLAAGECVAPARVEEPSFWNWKPVAAFAGLAMVFSAAWWLNMPPMRLALVEDRGPVLEASSSGVEFTENGSSLGVGAGNAQPVATSVSFDGSASARYIDDDTGQVTITTVYVQ
jgi:hypothetical protein